MVKKERRTFVRMEKNLEVDLTPLSKDHESKRESRSRTANLSMVGLFLEEDRRFPVGTRLKLKLILPGEDMPVVITAEVVHRVPGSGIGIKFLEFESDGRKRLLKFLGEDSEIKGSGS